MPTIAAIFFITLIVSVIWWFDKCSNDILKKWGDEHGFKVLWKEQRYLFFTGPFKWKSRNQTIYFLKVRDRDGCERSGWVRCGSFIGGVFFSDKIEVRWDDERPTATNDDSSLNH
jgi:hypothetical protein